jgi:tRNA(fMet)-specific endonuclease VapC
MLDTNTCSFLIRKRPEYLLDRLQKIVVSGHQVVISSITYAELSFGAINKKASPKMPGIVIEFVERLDEVLSWDKKAVEASAAIKKKLESAGMPISHNDILIAGHCISINAILVTDNVREFKRVEDLVLENWVDR